MSEQPTSMGGALEIIENLEQEVDDLAERKETIEMWAENTIDFLNTMRNHNTPIADRNGLTEFLQGVAKSGLFDFKVIDEPVREIKGDEGDSH